MTVEATILCDGATGRGLPFAGTSTLHLERFGSHPNVFLHVEDLHRATWRDVPDVLLDLLDIAAYVYAADQSVKRGGATGEDWGESWRRVLHFSVPVRLIKVWNDPEVRHSLISILSFLSEDEYHFAFEPRRNRDRFEGYGLFPEGRLSGQIEEVVLFSGGIDSFTGAVQEALVDQRKVVLVNHRSNPKIDPVLRGLTRELAQRAKETSPELIKVRVYKSEKLTREITQRTRSFLFAALGAATAAALKLNRLRFYENGVVSVNLPYCTQVVGARASRSTHPRVLSGLTNLFTLLVGESFTVENPFRDRTKADLVRLLAQAGCIDLLQLTRSCAHPRKASNEKPHCGVCSQCLDRRLSVLEANKQAYDPKDGYRVDIFQDEVGAERDQLMVAVFAESTRRIAQMSATRFFGTYGEVSRLSDDRDLTPMEAATEAFRLCQQHAQGIGRAFEQTMAQQASSAYWSSRPAWLLRMITGDARLPLGREASSQETPSLNDNVFRRFKKVWQVRYAGRPAFIMLPSVGAAYLHVLLQRPGESHSLFELVRIVVRDARSYALPDNDTDLDEHGVAALQARISELKEALERAQRENNTVDADLYTRELEQLMAEVRKNSRYRGKLRRERDPHKRLRSTVLMAITRVLKKIRDEDVVLADHLSLKNGYLRCGLNPIYDPNPPIHWDTDPASDCAQL